MNRLKYFIYLFISTFCIFIILIYSREKVLKNENDDVESNYYIVKEFNQKIIFPERTNAEYAHYLSPNKRHNQIYKYKNGEIIFSVNYDIDSAGYRNPLNLINKKSNAHILLTGCSLIFGIGLEENQTLRTKLASILPDYSIYNLGLPGSGINDHVYLWDKLDHSKYVKEKHGILFYFYFDGQYERNALLASYLDWAEATRPYYTLDADNKIQFGGRLSELNKWKTIHAHRELGMRRATLESYKLFEMQEPYQLDFQVEMIKRLKSIYLEKFPKGRFIFVLYPHSYSLNQNIEKLVFKLKESEIEVADYSLMNKYFEEFKEKNGIKNFNIHEREQHPNELSNELLAKQLKDIFLN